MRNVETEAARDKRYARAGEWLDALLIGHGTQGVEGLELTEVRIRLPTEGDPMVLMIVKGSGPEGDHVAFVGAATVVQALLAWRKRDQAQGLRWREDRPWGQAPEGA